MKESNYFESQRVYNEINEILCDAEAVVKNKSAPKHIWKIYQRILEYECISEELKEHLYDISSEIPSTLSNTNVGNSQTLINIDNAEGLLEVCNGAYENILNLLKQSRQLCIRSSSETNTDNDRINLDKQYHNLLKEIYRIASVTKWNDLTLIDGSFEYCPMIFQVGIKNSLVDRIYINLRDVCSIALGLGIDENGNILSSIITSQDARVSIGKIDCAIDTINFEKNNVSSTIVQLRSSENSIKDQLNSRLIVLIKILRKILDFTKCKGEFYFCNSSKKEIPDWLN